MDPNTASVVAAEQAYLLQVIIPLVVGFGAAYLGGRMSRQATMEAIEATHQHEAECEQAILQNFYQSILTEIETVWNRYYGAVGKALEDLPQDSPFLWPYPITQDHFVVYRSNSLLVGKIPDQALRKAVVETYSQTLGLIETYNMNNKLLSEAEHWTWIAAETKKPMHQRRVESAGKALAQCAGGLKNGHDLVKKNVQELVVLLKKNIVSA